MVVHMVPALVYSTCRTYFYLISTKAQCRLCKILCKARRPQSSTFRSTSLVFVFMNTMFECSLTCAFYGSRADDSQLSLLEPEFHVDF
jgi:hypothetical protein